MIKISASTHPATDELGNYIDYLEKQKVRYLHFDVMDGIFVKDVSLNHSIVKNLLPLKYLKPDIHLMVINPYKEVKKYLSLNPEILTVHYEAFSNKKKLIKTLIKISKHSMCGISISPSTEINEIFFLLKYVDLVLIMSVEPGKSGQKLLTTTYSRIKHLKNYIESNSLDIQIEVDGGVNSNNINKLEQVGVNIAVMGTEIYNRYKKNQLIDFLN